MIAADGVLVASGTATLECALLKRPMVITYRMPAFSWWMIKRKRYQPYFGLPNILCEKFVVPELIQEDATPENLTQALLNLVNNGEAVVQLEETFHELHRTLRQNTAQKAAAAPHPPVTMITKSSGRRTTGTRASSYTATGTAGPNCSTWYSCISAVTGDSTGGWK